MDSRLTYGIASFLCLLSLAWGGDLPFIENKGQMDKDTTYYAQTFGGTVFVTKEGDVVYSLPGKNNRGWVLKESFTGAKPRQVRGEGRTQTQVSYFRGKDPIAWQRSAPTYKSINLGEIREGIQVSLTAHKNNVEKIFRIQPGVSPDRIQVALEGSQGLAVEKDGCLKVMTEIGSVCFTKPVAFQIIDGRKKDVPAAYKLMGQSYGFQVGEYDTTQELVIDPLLASTFIGGADEEYGVSMARDDLGNIYIAGYTSSIDYPATVGAFKGGVRDMMISKFDGSLSTLLASTFIGGSSDEGHFYSAIAVDDSNNVYVTGNTISPDFPTTLGAYDETYNGGTPGPYGCGGDVYVCKLDNTLSTLIASTLIGGASHEYASSLALGPGGDLYIAGCSKSNNYPTTPGAYKETYASGEDLIVSCLTGDLTALKYSTYIGGTKDDYIECLNLDHNNNVIVSGWTSSTNFPTTPGALFEKYTGHIYDAFVSKLDPSLANLSASTYFGGSSWEFGYAQAVDANGHIYIAGHTASKNLPVSSSAYDPTYNSTMGYNKGDDIFIAKLDNNLAIAMACTYLGGQKWENAYALALDTDNNVYVVGNSNSLNYPVSNGAHTRGFQGGAKYGGDLVISKLDSNLTTLEASTYLGGTGDDGGMFVDLILDHKGDVYVTGETTSLNFPTTSNGYCPSHNGGADLFVAKLDKHLSANYELSEANGGQVLVPVDAGPANAYRNYMVFGSVTGTAPGTPLPGGYVTLPLNWDTFTNFLILAANTPMFQDFYGQLDANGEAKALIDLGPIPGTAGIVFHLAAACDSPWNYVSDAIAIEVKP